jgi:hypothetical protein
MLTNDESPRGKVGQQIALTGLAIYVLFAPHSVAASAIGVGIAGLGWVVKSVRTGSLGLTRSRFDLIIILSLLWTIASALLSEEPRISIAKLQASWCVFLFYLTRATLNRRTSFLLIGLLIVSASAGALYSAFDLVRGRGVVIESIAPESPFQQVGVQPGDTIWRVAGRRVYSVEDIDKQLRSGQVSVGIISRGEQIERPLTISQPASSGLTGNQHNHRFRASGWTRHYETFAELMQMIAQLALGLALSHLRNHGPNKYFRIAILAVAILTMGIIFTAMRTVVVAFVIGASLIALRSLRGTLKVAVTFALFFVLAFAAVVVWQTRDRNALLFGDRYVHR